MIEPEISSIKPQPADKSKIWKIWKVAIILGLVTAAEFYVALQFPESWKSNVCIQYLYYRMKSY